MANFYEDRKQLMHSLDKFTRLSATARARTWADYKRGLMLKTGYGAKLISNILNDLGYKEQDGTVIKQEKP